MDDRAAMIRRTIFNQDYGTGINRNEVLQKISVRLPVEFILTLAVEKITVLNLNDAKDFHALAFATGGYLGLFTSGSPGAAQRAPLGKGDFIAKKDHRLHLASSLQDRWPSHPVPVFAFGLVFLIIRFGRDKGRLLIGDADLMQQTADITRIVGHAKFAFDQHRDHT